MAPFGSLTPLLLVFIICSLEFRLISTTSQFFTKIGDNVKINKDINPFYEQRVDSIFQCSLICQRRKCIFAQILPQDRPSSELKCFLFEDIEDISVVLVPHAGGQIIKLDTEHCNLQNEVLPTLITPIPTTTTTPTTSSPTPSHPSECLDLYQKGVTQNGVYDIYLDGTTSIKVFSIMQDQGGKGAGWTVFQRRMDGSVNFNRPWLDYKNGFGDVAGEYWLGNEQIHQFTKNRTVTELLIYGKRFNGDVRFAHFEGFAVGDEASKYRLTSGQRTNNVGINWSAMNGLRFSTSDSDNGKGSRVCAVEFPSGWWLDDCFNMNLNGVYRPSPGSVPSSSQGIHWGEWLSHSESLKETLMMMRRKD